MSAILLSGGSATPTLQRLNSRDMMRALPGDDAVQAIELKTQKNQQHHHLKTPHWLAPPLAPKVMEPERHSKGADAAARLQRIEFIEIADVVRHDDDSRNYYVVNVYLKREQSRIPTNQSRFRRVLHARHGGCHTSRHGHHDAERTPDYTVQRRFSDFEKLRKDLWETLQYTHGMYCSFCDGFTMMMLFSSAQPGMITKTVLRSADLRAKILNRFLHNVVGEFQQNRPRCRFACHAIEHLPLVLGAFLMGDDDHEALDARDSASSNPIESPTSGDA